MVRGTGIVSNPLHFADSYLYTQGYVVQVILRLIYGTISAIASVQDVGRQTSKALKHGQLHRHCSIREIACNQNQLPSLGRGMDRCKGVTRQQRDRGCAKLANSSDSNNRQHVNSPGRVENADAPNSVEHSSLLPGVRGFASRPRRSTDLCSANGLRNTKKRSIFLHHQDHDIRLAILDLRGSFLPGHIGHCSRETSRYRTTLAIQGIGYHSSDFACGGLFLDPLLGSDHCALSGRPVQDSCPNHRYHGRVVYNHHNVRVPKDLPPDSTAPE